MKYKCICGKEYLTQSQLNGHKAQCKKYQGELFDRIKIHFTKEFLEWWIYQKHENINILCKMFNKKYSDVGIKLNAGKLIQYAHSLGIRTPSVKEGNNSPHVRRHRKYHNNLAKGSKGYEKRQKTLESEGITNVFQRESVKRKIKQTMLDRYGVSSSVYLPTYKSNNGIESKPHKKVMEFLDELKIDYMSEPKFQFTHFNEDLNRNFCPRPDIYIPSINLVVEIYGDRWHANPKQYNKDQIIHLWEGDKTAEQIWNYDYVRSQHFVKYFSCNLYIIWESDIKNELYKEPLKQYLNELFENQINKEDLK